MYLIESEKGFLHFGCWWHNVNPMELMEFESESQAREYINENELEKEVRWLEIKTG